MGEVAFRHRLCHGFWNYPLPLRRLPPQLILPQLLPAQLFPHQPLSPPGDHSLGISLGVQGRLSMAFSSRRRSVKPLFCRPLLRPQLLGASLTPLVGNLGAGVDGILPGNEGLSNGILPNLGR